MHFRCFFLIVISIWHGNLLFINTPPLHSIIWNFVAGSSDMAFFFHHLSLIPSHPFEQWPKTPLIWCIKGNILPSYIPGLFHKPWNFRISINQPGWTMAHGMSGMGFDDCSFGFVSGPFRVQLLVITIEAHIKSTLPTLSRLADDRDESVSWVERGKKKVMGFFKTRCRWVSKFSSTQVEKIRDDMYIPRSPINGDPCFAWSLGLVLEGRPSNIEGQLGSRYLHIYIYINRPIMYHFDPKFWGIQQNKNPWKLRSLQWKTP